MSANQSENFQFLSTVQNKAMGGPQTIASAATISPAKFFSIITGTVQIANITPPIDGVHLLVFVFTNAAPGTFLTTGNVLNACVPTQNQLTFALYDPDQAKYYVTTTNLT